MDNMKTKKLPYLILFCGILIVSSAALIIRHLQTKEYSSLGIAAVRLSFAAIVLSIPVALKFRNELTALTKPQFLKAFFAGFFLAIHFGAWISSMEYTSVSSSAALVSTTPIWVAVFSILFFKEKIAKFTSLGILVSIIGSALIFLSDKDSSTVGLANPILGNSLAMLGAIGMCFYLILGRQLTRLINLWVYVWIVYSSAAFFLISAAIFEGVEFGYFPEEFYLMCLLLAIGPQLLGHTSYNWSMKYISPVVISIAILGEPIFTAILAGIFLNESLSYLQACGFAVLFLGILLALWGER